MNVGKGKPLTGTSGADEVNLILEYPISVSMIRQEVPYLHGDKALG